MQSTSYCRNAESMASIAHPVPILPPTPHKHNQTIITLLQYVDRPSAQSHLCRLYPQLGTLGHELLLNRLFQKWVPILLYFCVCQNSWKFDPLADVQPHSTISQPRQGQQLVLLGQLRLLSTRQKKTSTFKTKTASRWQYFSTLLKIVIHSIAQMLAFILVISGMTNQSQLFDVMITNEDLLQLRQENKELVSTNQGLKYQNEKYSKIINRLTRQIRLHAPIVESGLDLQVKVRLLSKTNLQLSTVIVELREKIESQDDMSGQNNQSLKPNLKKSVEEKNCLQIVLNHYQKSQLLLVAELQQSKKNKEYTEERLYESRILQSEYEQKLARTNEYLSMLEQKLQKGELILVESEWKQKLKSSQNIILENQLQKQLFTLTKKHSESLIEDYQLRLQQKQSVIQDLQAKVKIMKIQHQSYLIAQNQIKIISSWKIDSMQVQKVQNIVGNIKNTLIINLRKQVEQLQTKREEYDCLFINQRQILETRRKQLQSKEKSLMLAEKQLKQKQSQLQCKNTKLQAILKQREQMMKAQYHSKIKSLKGFADCPQCDSRKEAYQQVIKHLKHQLEKAARQYVQKQDQFDYINQILSNMKTSNELSFVTAVESDISYLASSITTKVDLKEVIGKKKQQYLDINNEQIKKAEASYDVGGCGKEIKQ